MVETLLQVENLTKKFHQVVANDRVSFDVRSGEIHCLLGENGAGKSTLAECLYGFYQPESGRINFRGKPIELKSPADAIRLGIGMVHQHFVLVSSFSVLENIVVGTESAGTILDLRGAEAKLTELCRKYDVELDLHAKIWELPVGKQQWVEILKALYVGAQLLILDEPTAVLTPQESRSLFKILRQMTDEGLAIILISHKLNEVLQSDRVTILRKGMKVATVQTADTTKIELTNMMVGRDVEFEVTNTPGEVGAPILEVKDLRAQNEWGTDVLTGLSLTVCSGEILGIAGVAGNGQKELFETLVGVRPATGGQVLLNGDDMTNKSPKQIMDRGVGLIPEDRFAEGLVPQFTVGDNLILGQQGSENFAKLGFLDFARIREFGERAISDFEIVTPSAATVTSTLSGGNAQKVIVAREFAQSTQCILANQPSRGLDVGVIEYMHRCLLEKRDAGFAILLASEDLEEIFNITDRVAVIHKGRILEAFPTADANIETIGLLMAGHEEAPADRPTVSKPAE